MHVLSSFNSLFLGPKGWRERINESGGTGTILNAKIHTHTTAPGLFTGRAVVALYLQETVIVGNFGPDSYFPEQMETVGL